MDFREIISAIGVVALLFLDACSGLKGLSGSPVSFRNGTYDGASICTAEDPEAASSMIFNNNNYIYTMDHYDPTCQHIQYQLISSGTYVATTDGIAFTQQSLFIVPSIGESAQVQPSCDVSLTDQQPTAIAGMSCGGHGFNSNGSTYTLCSTTSPTSFTVSAYDNDIDVGSGASGCTDLGTADTGGASLTMETVFMWTSSASD